MKFKYKYKPHIYAVFIIVYVLAAACFVWNLIRLVNSLSSGIALDVYDYISVCLCLLLPIAFAAFETAALVSSYYSVTDKNLTVKFGFLADKYQISDVDSLVKNVKTDRLTIVFKDESELNVVIDKKDFDDFSAEILKLNKSASYEQTSTTKED